MNATTITDGVLTIGGVPVGPISAGPHPSTNFGAWRCASRLVVARRHRPRCRMATVSGCARDLEHREVRDYRSADFQNHAARRSRAPEFQRRPLQLSRFMGHAKVTTTLAIYTHLFDDDHAETMAALEAMSRPAALNVVPMRRRG